MLKGWDFLVICLAGNSGGLLMGWKENVMLINSFSLSLGLLSEVERKRLGKTFSILKLYGPYEGKVKFWDKTFNYRNLMVPNLILHDDLNFTLFQDEIRGSFARVAH